MTRVRKFISYDSISKGYKLYNPSNEKIIVSRDVEFDEEGEWDWNTPQEDYDFLPYFKKKEQANDVLEQPISLMPSPLSPTRGRHRPVDLPSPVLFF